MTSSLSASTPERRQVASLDILIARRGGGAPSKTTRPSMAPTPIVWPAGMAPGGGAGGPAGSGVQPNKPTTQDSIAAGTAAQRTAALLRPSRGDGLSDANSARKEPTLVNSDRKSTRLNSSHT